MTLAVWCPPYGVKEHSKGARFPVGSREAGDASIRSSVQFMAV